MMRNLGPAVLLVAFLLLSTASCSRRVYPQWRAVPMGLVGSWTNATSVVVADLQNVEYLGSQKIDYVAGPPAGRNFNVYWCQGDLRIRSVVMGERLPSGKKFLWGAGQPGCGLIRRGAEPERGPTTQVWFVRAEGNYIRPVVDAMGVYFVAFNGEQDLGSGPDPAKKFAELLLTPEAVDTNAHEYGRWWSFELVSTACFILGRERCSEELNRLAALGDLLLKKKVCEFLSSQFREACRDRTPGSKLRPDRTPNTPSHRPQPAS